MVYRLLKMPLQIAFVSIYIIYSDDMEYVV